MPGETLSGGQFRRAAAFIRTRGRPLEKAQFDREFQDAPAATVLEALRPFQNGDGGFGHGLESDIRAPCSSVLCTTLALQILRRLGSGTGEPMLRAALGYLHATFEPATGVWPIVPGAIDDAPHAPWWDNARDRARMDQDWKGFRHNPRADVIGYLVEWCSDCHRDEWCKGWDPEWRRALDAFGWPRPEPGGDLDMHELLCWLRLYGTPGLDADIRQHLIRVLSPAVDRLVQRDPAHWARYGLTPVSVVDGPTSPFLAVVGEKTVQACLDHLLTRQQDDGSWPVTWHWDGRHPEVWDQARAEWQGVVTLGALRTLRAFGRLGVG